MTQSTKNSNWLLVTLPILVSVGLVGGFGGYLYAKNSFSLRIQSLELEMAGVEDEYKMIDGQLKAAQAKFKKQIDDYQVVIKAAEHSTDIAMAFAVGMDSSANNCTLEEAMDLVERLKRFAEQNEMVRTKFSQRVDVLKTLFENDLNPTSSTEKAPSQNQRDVLPPNVNSWRGMAIYWKSKFLAEGK